MLHFWDVGEQWTGEWIEWMVRDMDVNYSSPFPSVVSGRQSYRDVESAYDSHMRMKIIMTPDRTGHACPAVMFLCLDIE